MAKINAPVTPPENVELETPFFAVTVPKLVTLTTFTWGFYFLVWAYFNWDKARLTPSHKFGIVTRSLILPLVFNFPLFRKIRRATLEHGSQPLPSPTFLALAFLVLSLFSLWRASWWSLLAFASVFPLAIVQARVNSLHTRLGFDARANGSFTLLNIIACVLGGGYLAFHVAPLLVWLYQVAVWKLRS